MASEGAYDAHIVFAWLDAHCTKREDGRYTHIGRRLLEDTHRDTFDRWRLALSIDPDFRVPLERFTDVLFVYDVEWYEFEDWATTEFGWNAYSE